MDILPMGPRARAAGSTHEQARLAGRVADGAARCHGIVERMTVEPFHGRAMAAALNFRAGCIGDLAVSLGQHGRQVPALPDGSAGNPAALPDDAVATALLDLKLAIARATQVLEEGMRLREAQCGIIAEIQASLLRSELRVRDLAADTNARARYLAGFVAGR